MFLVCSSYYYILCAVYYPVESSFEVKIETDRSDITEHLHDDKPTIESRG